MAQNFFDVRSAFFVPMWRRVVATVLPALWTVMEVLGGNTLWALAFGAATAWLVYQFFVVWEDPADD